MFKMSQSHSLQKQSKNRLDIYNFDMQIDRVLQQQSEAFDKKNSRSLGKTKQRISEKIIRTIIPFYKL